jgi:hypothetical protein
MDPNSPSATNVRDTGHRCAGSRRLLIDSTTDVDDAARALAVGAVTATAFGNFYAIVARPVIETVRRINVIKGRRGTRAARPAAAADPRLRPGGGQMIALDGSPARLDMSDMSPCRARG